MFRLSCLKRDDYKCRVCGYEPTNVDELDVHHIENRNTLPNGGYVLDNGISLCPECHLKAELVDNGGEMIYDKYSEDKLYKLIGSSKKLAIEKAKRLI